LFQAWKYHWCFWEKNAGFLSCWFLNSKKFISKNQVDLQILSLMCDSCHIRRLTKRWNSRRTWNICYIFNFQLKKIRSKIIQISLNEVWSFISFELRHLNSMKMSQKANFGCSIFQLKIKRKQIFQVRHQFGHFIKCRIWHESHINLLIILSSFPNQQKLFPAYEHYSKKKYWRLDVKI
jgi:hypothetical protein